MIFATASPRRPSSTASPLPVVARLLGHSQVSMTLRYAHVAEKEVEAAAQRVGKVIANLCGISDP